MTAVKCKIELQEKSGFRYAYEAAPIVEERVCATKGCGTKLNKYNKYKYCYKCQRNNSTMYAWDCRKK